MFLTRLAEILQMDGEHFSGIADYKKAFTADAVRKIHEAVVEAWPKDTDLATVLAPHRDEASSLYIGDYTPEFLGCAIVRQAVYANKILIVDPFTYCHSVRDEFNPLLNPNQYRTQTLRNTNLWFALMPWIVSGVVELIRTPGDLDPRLNWESINRQTQKFDENIELKKARDRSVDELHERHFERMAKEDLLLSTPDEHLRTIFDKLNLAEGDYTFDDYLAYIQRMRDENINFLEPLGKGPDSGQLHIMTTGASYDIALHTAKITKSYLVTDLYVKWREIELGRDQLNVESTVWSPFAKAFQEARLKFLNNLTLPHALMLRSEGRLESLRNFLHKVWVAAREGEEYSEANAILLAEELRHEVGVAAEEWEKIDRDLLKIIGAELGAGLLAAGPLIASGHGNFLAAAAVATGAANIANSTLKRRRFPDRYPAAFFINIDDDEQ